MLLSWRARAEDGGLDAERERVFKPWGLRQRAADPPPARPGHLSTGEPTPPWDHRAQPGWRRHAAHAAGRFLATMPVPCWRPAPRPWPCAVQQLSRPRLWHELVAHASRQSETLVDHEGGTGGLVLVLQPGPAAAVVDLADTSLADLGAPETSAAPCWPGKLNSRPWRRLPLPASLREALQGRLHDFMGQTLSLLPARGDGLAQVTGQPAFALATTAGAPSAARPAPCFTPIEVDGDVLRFCLALGGGAIDVLRRGAIPASPALQNPAWRAGEAPCCCPASSSRCLSATASSSSRGSGQPPVPVEVDWP